MKLKVDVTDNVLFLELLCFPFSRVFWVPLGEDLKSAFTFRDCLDGNASKSQQGSWGEGMQRSLSH